MRRCAVGLGLAVLATLGCHEELNVGAPAELIEVEAFTFSGVEAVDEADLRNVLLTKPSPWLPGGETRYFDRDAFEQDLERIEIYYANHGYPEAEIVSYDVGLNEDGDGVRLHVEVEEGEPLLVTSVDLVNFDVLTETVRAELRSQLSIAEGEPVVQQELAESGELAADVLKNHGYPWAGVTVARRHDDRGVAVLLRAEPGQLAFFGPIEVVGNTSVSDDVIRRQLLFRPAERYQLDAVRGSLRQLYALELFEYVNIEFDGEEREGQAFPTRVIVTEGDHRRVDFSLGYGTEEKGRAEVEWRHVNFFGGARTMTVHGKWSWLDRGVEATFVQPYLFAPRTSLSLRGQSWYLDEPAFTARSNGGRTTVTHILGPNSSASAHFGYEYQRSQIAQQALLDPTLRDELIALGLNPETGVQDGLLSTVGIAARLFRVDDPLNPTRGYFVGGDLEQAGGWLPGTYHYLKAMGELRGYYTPQERITLAGRMRYGGIDPFGPPSNIPFFKRYFLGGATSLRGWGRYEVAPLSNNGVPIGGNTLFETSLEVRTRVWGNLGLVGFVDIGNVWPTAWDGRFDDLLYDAGPGLRYLTPIGPVRLDVAYQINRLDGLQIAGESQRRPWRIHFSIGQAF